LLPSLADRFDWRDGDRLIVFGRGAVARAGDLLGEGYALLTTERAAASASAIVEAARTVVHVPSGRVDEVAAALVGSVEGGALVALGGGRVIDVAKAIAAVRGAEVAAVPTTLSAAEMTRLHRQLPGTERPVRPRLVLNDPALSASQPAAELAASALNALGHALEAPLTAIDDPPASLAGEEAARLLTGAWDDADPGDGARDALALGALLSGYAIDAAGYGLHHVMAQTLACVGGVPHATANAILLPHTAEALARRFPERTRRMAAAIGDQPARAAAALAARGGVTRLRDAGVSEPRLAECAQAAAARPELELTPPRASREEILGLYRAAW
jgi:alcohol dehydrogenase class IV